VSVSGAALRGSVAGSIGTLAMDLLWYSPYRRERGAAPFHDWEVTRDVRCASSPAGATRIDEKRRRSQVRPSRSPAGVSPLT
jgi:hypothetical protein